MEMDHQRLSGLVAQCCASEEIAKAFLDHWRPRPGQTELEGDWCWLALTVLWERWFPEVPNFERLDDAMQNGYKFRGKPAGCDIWIDTWADLLTLKAKARCSTLAEFDDRFGGTQSIFNWIQDFEMELGNAAIDHPKYHETRVRVCEEFLLQFDKVDELTVGNMRRAWAESLYALGDAARSDALFRGWLADDPQWGWGWIGWADLYYFARPPQQKDLGRAEALLKLGLAIGGVRDAAYILERLADLYEDQGRHKEAAETRRHQADASASATHASSKSPGQTTPMDPRPGEVTMEDLPSRASPPAIGGERWESAPPKTKVGRNEPCPCGSGKKFKKCCGT